MYKSQDRYYQLVIFSKRITEVIFQKLQILQQQEILAEQNTNMDFHSMRTLDHQNENAFLRSEVDSF